MQYAPQIHQPSRTLVVPLLAALLGAAVATATFALVNIEDEAANVSLPTQAVQSAPPSDAVAGQRNDGGPEEGTAAQAMQPPYAASPDYRSSYQPATPEADSTVAVDPSTGFRYDGGPNEGSSADAMADTQPPKPGVQPRYDGGPDEGSSAGAIAQP